MTPTQPPPHTHTPHPHIWGDVKKTSPMKGDVFFTGDRQTDVHTDVHTDGHRNSMTESAQWADSVKRIFPHILVLYDIYMKFSFGRI